MFAEYPLSLYAFFSLHSMLLLNRLILNAQLSICKAGILRLFTFICKNTTTTKTLAETAKMRHFTLTSKFRFSLKSGLDQTKS